METGSARTEHDIKIEYIERDIREIKSFFQQWIGKNDEQMATLARSISQKEALQEERYVRNDLLKIQLESINNGINLIQSAISQQNKKVEEVALYIPMLERIKQERETLYRTVLDYVMKGVFALFTSGVAVLAVKKLFN